MITLQPTQEQLAALLAYKTKHGAQWKDNLRSQWIDGTDASQRVDGQSIGHLLRQVRNNFGPTWLKNFKEN